VQCLLADSEAESRVASTEQQDVDLQVITAEVPAPVQTQTGRQQHRPLQGPTCFLFSLTDLSRHGDGAGNTVEENSSVFSLIRVC